MRRLLISAYLVVSVLLGQPGLAFSAAEYQPVVVSTAAELRYVLADARMSGKTIHIAKPITVDHDLVVDNNPIGIDDDGSLTSLNNSSIRFNAPFSSGRSQVFRGNLKVIFGVGSAEKIYPQWFGAHSTDEPGYATFDSTGAIQQAVDAAGAGVGAVYLPRGRYRTTRTLFVDASTHLVGDGFSTTPGKVDVKSGTVLEYYGANECLYAGARSGKHGDVGERIAVSDMAFVAKGQNQIGLKAAFTRYSRFSNLYFTGFDKGFYFGPEAWLCKIDLVQCMSCRTGLYSDSGGEDSVFSNCLFRGYGSKSVGAVVNYHGQTNIFIGCDFSNNNYGLRINNGEYKGTPLSTHTTVLNCMFENCGTAAIEVDSGSSIKFPNLIVQGSRFIFHGSAGPGFPNRDTNSAACIVLNKANSALIMGNIASGYKNFITTKSPDQVRNLTCIENDTAGIKEAVAVGFANGRKTFFENNVLSISSLHLDNLPTSPAQLKSGDIWADKANGYVLKIKP